MKTIEQLKAAMKAIIDAAKADGDRDLTEAESADIDRMAAEVETLKAQHERSRKSAELVASLSVSEPAPVDAPADTKSDDGLSMGQRFVKSAAFRSFKSTAPSDGNMNGAPLNIRVNGVGHVSDIVSSKATLLFLQQGPKQWFLVFPVLIILILLQLRMFS